MRSTGTGTHYFDAGFGFGMEPREHFKEWNPSLPPHPHEGQTSAHQLSKLLPRKPQQGLSFKFS